MSGILLLTLSSCATTDQGRDEGDASVEETAGTNQPSWYSALTTSKSDSASFTGFARAVSADREEARELSEQTAIKNLRFEIDRYAEEIRRELTAGGANGSLESAAFIRNLRNAVESMPVGDAMTETEFFGEGSVVHAFTRVSISSQAVIDMLSAQINHDDFVELLRQKAAS
ncbi:hypothetical protein DDZ15_06350 [Rhodohalobacter mucosus]|uniref:LPP20 lipoprotein n=2 Tax=Rhodohalobacter mucosus TaxID=2079485 RepID=A0A316TTD6_9BACT|nr:hypothetical protein DDZ15_06350 [Rhodohalobacter mucosus]